MKSALVILIAILIIIAIPGGLIFGPLVLAKFRKREEPEPEQIVGDIPFIDPRFLP